MHRNWGGGAGGRAVLWRQSAVTATYQSEVVHDGWLSATQMMWSV
jgi:hypothetical protein